MSAHGTDSRTGIPRFIRAFAVPIILIWVAFTAAVNLLVPQVEKVGMANAISMSPQDAPAVADAPKPTRKRTAKQEAAAAPETPAAPAKPVDSYPDEYEGAFQIHRVVRRPGRPVAIEASGEHGKVWIATSVGEYADLAESNVNGEMTIEVARIGQTMQVMRVLGPVKPLEVNPEEVPF